MTQRPSQSVWSAELAALIAAEVRRYRDMRGMSAQQLSDRCAELGMEVPRSVIANLESGRRAAVSVAELLVLARALQVPPVSLIFPAGYEREIEGLPGTFGDPYDFALWVTGDDPLEHHFSEDEKKNFEESPIAGMRRVSVWVDEYIDILQRQVDARKRLYQAFLEQQEVNRRRVALEGLLDRYQERSKRFQEMIDNGSMTEEELAEAKRFIKDQNVKIDEYRELSETWSRAHLEVADLRLLISTLEEMVDEVAIRAREALRSVSARGWLVPDEAADISIFADIDMDDREFLKRKNEMERRSDGRS